jgi:Methyltransferase domain
MTTVEYNSEQNTHTLTGASAALAHLLEGGAFHSLLDVGCGPGMWVSAAAKAGLTDVWGIDGNVPAQPLSPSVQFKSVNLTTAWNLGRRFDLAICLEVAEHLPEEFASHLVESLCSHADAVYFSAAIPGQPGQHHVNCQWPDYWQTLFNKFGYACSDEIRWKIWNDDQIEPWYRQNLFAAVKSSSAGSEPRIRPVVHPVIHAALVTENRAQSPLQRIKSWIRRA